MYHKNQEGYIDMQITPTIFGIVLLLGLLGLINYPEFDLENNLLMFYLFLLLATAVLLFGFVMHLIGLGYPESPFNRHSSSVMMTLLCTGPLVYGAYRFYSAGLQFGFILFLVLSVLVIATSNGFAVYRNKKRQ